MQLKRDVISRNNEREIPSIRREILQLENEIANYQLK